ncbi:hypothetical protein [Mycoplasma seminis]|uniref:Uncharacterized protein n=1 Tax=Mycoplasma seminis TaxID=512749 RepID=A0ABY9HAA9_9MOLU|nr:hypothetical protein [Mycoplasma seminis]WLP85532.1 hypothetical protein Q8852_04420 [Mycoplasma seminis]
MENKLIATVNLFASVSNTIQPTANVEVVKEKVKNNSVNEQNQKEVEKIQKSLLEKHSKEINNIAENVLNTKKSSKSVLGDIDNETINQIAEDGLKELVKNKTISISKEQIEKMQTNEMKLKIANDIKNEIKKVSLDFKKTQKMNKKPNYKKTITEVKRVQTTSNPEWTVNDDGSINSKFILLKLKKLDDLYNEYKINYLPQLEMLQHLTEIKKALVASSIAFAASAAILYFVSFWTGGITGAFAVAASVTAGACSLAATIIDSKINKFKSEFKQLENIYYKISMPKFWTVSSNVIGLISFANDIAAWKQITNSIKYNLPASVSNFSAALGITTNLLSIGFNSVELANTCKELEINGRRILEIKEILRNIVSQKELFEKVDWVVVDETPMDKLYTEGGKGGKNLMFMNLKTKEVKPLEYFLSLTKSQLYYMGLMKVHHPQTGWYIKKLPNDSKEDNLG